jgi:hypothetical protein
LRIFEQKRPEKGTPTHLEHCSAQNSAPLPKDAQD